MQDISNFLAESSIIAKNKQQHSFLVQADTSDIRRMICEKYYNSCSHGLEIL